MTAASSIFRNAAILLQDEEHLRWTLPELCNWLNEGQLAIVLAKPSALSGPMAHDLVAGSRQTIPAGATQLLDVVCNLGDDGAPLRSVRTVRRQLIDAQEPGWRSGTRRREVRSALYDEQAPTVFEVYPPNDGTGRLELLLGLTPAPSVAAGDPDSEASYGAAIALPDPYSVPLTDYLVSRCYAKDDVTGNGGLAQYHYQLFASAIGLKVRIEGASSPNARRVS